MHVQLSLGNLKQVVLRRIPETIYRLQKESLLVAQELDLAVAQRSSDTSIESDCFLRALLPYSTASVQYRRL
ncbi:MAG: hypothetical protein ACREX9_22595 [Gammaproteobacteria bacterium]